ncbi:unnamed protein product [Amoebophrya sp. A120]|nr:unnamed protein product [Amoebophrya sp. A120]|eukprot:GSA120T00009480001.1
MLPRTSQPLNRPTRKRDALIGTSINGGTYNHGRGLFIHATRTTEDHTSPRNQPSYGNANEVQDNDINPSRLSWSFDVTG